MDFIKVNGYGDLRRNSNFYFWDSQVQDYVLLEKSECEQYNLVPDDFHLLLVRRNGYCMVVSIFDLFIRCG